MEIPQVMTGTNVVEYPGVNNIAGNSTWSDFFDPHSDIWNDFNNNWEKFKEWIGKMTLKGATYGPNGAINNMIHTAETGHSYHDDFEAKYGQNMLTGEPVGSDSNADSMYSDVYKIFQDAVDIFNQNVNKQYDFNQREAAVNRMWQEYMSNTAYQRAMVDLKAAGINPLLAFGSISNGASTPSGDSASGSLGNSNSLFNSLMTSVMSNKGIGVALIGVVARIIAAIIGAKSTKNINYSDSSSDWMKDWFNGS